MQKQWNCIEKEDKVDRASPHSSEYYHLPYLPGTKYVYLDHRREALYPKTNHNQDNNNNNNNNYHIQGIPNNRLGKISTIPHLPLTLRTTIETRRYNLLSIANPYHLRALSTVVRSPFLYHDILTRIENAMFLILRRNGKQTSIVVPVKVLRELVAIKCANLLLFLHIPNFTGVIPRNELYGERWNTQKRRQRSSQRRG